MSDSDLQDLITPRGIPGSPCDAIALLRRHATEIPTAPAVIDDSGTYTYADLERDSAHVAALVGQRGICPGDAVGVHTSRSYAALAGLLGVLRAGAIYVPLDPRHPGARLEKMCRAADVQIVLHDPTHRPASLGPTLEWTPGSSAPPALDIRPAPEADAYIMFTSGSTGEPKGVRITRSNLAHFLGWVTTTFTRDEMTVTTAMASVGFDLSILELLGPLATGGSIRILSDHLAVLGAVPEPTMIIATPSVAAELLRARMIPSSVSTVLLCGEVLTRGLADRLLDQTTIRRLVNTYGPTEATVLVTACDVGKGADGPVPLGTPISGTDLAIVDENLRPVGDSSPGELLIMGPQLAAGYLGDAPLNRSRFTQLERDGRTVRAYRTGDLCTFDPDGQFYYLGRADRQIKLRGFRVEPGEVETAVQKISGGSVVVRAEGTGPAAILACYVAGTGPLDPKAVKRSLRSELPDYMIPSRFVAIDAVPLTASGKVDHSELDRLSSRIEAPKVNADDPEPTVVGLVREVLGHGSPIRPEHDFIDDLGGTSLTLITLLARIEETCATRIDMRKALDDTTIAGLSKLVDETAGEAIGPRAPRLRPLPIDRPLFLINPYIGAALRHRRLLRHLKSPSRVIAVDLYDSAAGRMDPISIEALAGVAHSQIKSTQPEGPYLIGGHSAGGLVALEVVRRLQAEGDEVRELLIVDTPLTMRSVDYAYSEAVMNWPELRAASWEDRKVMVKAIAQGRLSVYRQASDQSLTGTVERSARLVNLAVKRYRPTPWTGDITLLWTEQGSRMARRRRNLGWDEVVSGEIRSIAVPGQHNQLFEPRFVDALAEQIDAYLARQDAPSYGRVGEVNPRRSDLDHELNAWSKRNQGARLLLFGNFANGNVGDDAILASTLRSAGSHARVVVVSRNPALIRARFGVKSESMTSPRLLWELLRADIVAIGGGGLFGNGMKLNTAFLPFLVLFAQRVLGKQSAFLGTGAYSSSPRFVQEGLKKVARRSALVAVRDHESASVLGAPHAVIVPDPAITLPVADEAEIDSAFLATGIPGDARLLGISLKPCGYADRDARQVEVAVEAIEWWLANTEGDAILFCFSENGDNGLGAATSDGSMARSVVESLPRRERVHVVGPAHRPEVVKGMIGRLEMMIAHRLHAQIFAWTQDVPLLGLSYERKSDAFLTSAGQTRCDLWELQSGIVARWLKQNSAWRPASGED